MSDELPEALRERLEDAGVSYRTLAERLRKRGLDRSKDTVNLWVNGVQPMRPDEIFVVEEVLELPPGDLSRVAGFLPTTARTIKTTEDAIRADHRLGPAAKRFMLAALRGVIAEEKRR